MATYLQDGVHARSAASSSVGRTNQPLTRTQNKHTHTKKKKRRTQYDELNAAVMVCYQYGDAVRKHAPAATLAHERLAKAIRKAGSKAVFDTFDVDKSGQLDLVELVHMIRMLVPDMTLSEMRYSIAKLREGMDTDGDGLVSYEELVNKFCPQSPSPNKAPPTPAPSPAPEVKPTPPPPQPQLSVRTQPKKRRKGPTVTIVSSAPPTAFATTWPVASGGLSETCTISSPGKIPPPVPPDELGAHAVTLVPPTTPRQGAYASTPSSSSSSSRRELTIRIPPGYGVRRISVAARAAVCDVFADVGVSPRADSTGIYVCSVSTTAADSGTYASDDLFTRRGGMEMETDADVGQAIENRVVWDRPAPEPVKELVLNVGGDHAPSIDGVEIVVEPLIGDTNLFETGASRTVRLAESVSAGEGVGSAASRSVLASLASRLERMERMIRGTTTAPPASSHEPTTTEYSGYGYDSYYRGVGIFW